MLQIANFAVSSLQYCLELMKVLLADPLFDTCDIVLPFGV